MLNNCFIFTAAILHGIKGASQRLIHYGPVNQYGLVRAQIQTSCKDLRLVAKKSAFYDRHCQGDIDTAMLANGRTRLFFCVNMVSPFQFE